MHCAQDLISQNVSMQSISKVIHFAMCFPHYTHMAEIIANNSLQSWIVIRSAKGSDWAVDGEAYFCWKDKENPQYFKNKHIWFLLSTLPLSGFTYFPLSHSSSCLCVHSCLNTYYFDFLCLGCLSLSLLRKIYASSLLYIPI